ncbi:DUF6600 domain-containing protein [Devosia submarina]|uniref:DUF6600 domain-containing protein n=1 Tax=Devosia submarina TaxID=1173082 RepID=UPI000D360812|nr:DUF6600 domain-containing protein [Devosia submarina]
MRKPKIFAGLALAGMLLSTSALSPVGPLAVSPAQAQSASVSFNLFFDELEPHGVWVRHPQYRYVFCPTGVDTSWRPYTRGRWLYLQDTGWYFASDEPFAWATYHYGRWLDDDNLGWCWVPGTKWAPAWVSWRRGGDAIGWAPLPPEREGFSVSVEVVREDFPEDYWVFVPTRSFIEPDLSVSIVFGNDARSYYRETEFVGPVVVQGDVVTNNVIEVSYIEQQINQEITVYNVEESNTPAAANVTGESTVQIFNQDLEEPTEEIEPPEAVEAAEAPELIRAEGGTIDAEAGAEAGADAEDGIDSEDTDATDPVTEQTEGVDPATAGADAETTTEADDSAITAEEAGDAEAADTEQSTQVEEDAELDQPADAEEAGAVSAEEETTPAQASEQTEDDAASAADESEAVTDTTDATTDEEAGEEAAPADASTEEPEATVQAEDEAVTSDCPPELLVGGVCQTPGEEIGDTEVEVEETDSAPSDSGETNDAGADEGAEEAVTQ